MAVTVALCAALAATVRVPVSAAADDILQKSRAIYAGLKSYSDTGVVTVEYGADSVDKNAFVTRFSRAPRRFFLEYRAQSGGRYVVWGDPDAFHTWWKTTGDQYDYPNPDNLPAINGSGRNTGNAALKIPTLLYAKAPLLSDFANLSDVVDDGREPVGGHACYRLRGLARDVYTATGREANIRTMTLWIDSESLLIRKVLEEWKARPGTRSRVITSYEPQANVPIDEALFKFVPSGGK